MTDFSKIKVGSLVRILFEGAGQKYLGKIGTVCEYRYGSPVVMVDGRETIWKFPENIELLEREPFLFEMK